MARKAPRKPDGRKTKVTKRQLKVIQARAEGKTLKESGEAAGYSPKNAAQSAYQALAGLHGRMTALLDEAGLGRK
jgi:DNA-binding NarL/FixJ family response regulator